MSLSVEALNHVALYVENIEKSVQFYQNTLRLPLLPRPAFDFPGAWFRLGEAQELHLIGIRQDPVVSGSRSNHFALQITDAKAWEAHLIAQKATFRAPKPRPDGATQIFLQDPDGYWVELLAY